jgi:aryl-alcohol dehydrogenase-like predicted oxidoreductase
LISSTSTGYVWIQRVQRGIDPKWDWSTSIAEVMDALDVEVKAGRVLYLGASDMPAWVVSACNEYAM